MNAEPLDIRDKRFLIKRLIEQAPKNTLIREFFKNADESATTSEEGKKVIRIYPTSIGSVRKLTFWNTGVGMDDKELKLATDLSSSINKEMAIDGNFGIGAKVSGLSMSPEGIRYRSCKYGTVSEVTIGYDETEQTYVRFPVELPSGIVDTVYDVTEAAVLNGQDVGFDWTEVVLLGENVNHDTVAEPMGLGKRVDRSFVATSIFRRFARFGLGVVVHIDVAMTKGGGKGQTGTSRKLKTLEDVLDKLPMHERITDTDTEICIHYIHDPKNKNYSHSLSATANPATASTSFCALVHKGERYDIKSSNVWSAAAPNFGIPFGSKVITIEIEVPDQFAQPNQYRDGLAWPDDRSSMQTDYFADWVRELMPEWVKNIIRSESPQSDENLTDIQADLQKILDEFRVPKVTLSSTKRPSSFSSESVNEGRDSSEPTELETEFSGEYSDTEKSNSHLIEPNSQRSNPNKMRKAPDGAKASRSSQSLERAPKIEILTGPDEITEKNLKGRAGRFYESTQTLFVNGLYPAVERIVAELEPELLSLGEPEIVRASILKASRHLMAFRVGKATCYAISKRLVDNWSSDDLARATSPESLSLAADDYKQSRAQTKKLAKELIETAKIAQSRVA